MNKQFKAGDVVVLKSGGPSMTVQSVDEYVDGLTKAHCTWFVGTELKEAFIAVEALEEE